MANIQVINTKIGAMTDPDGHFVLDLPTGSHQLKISMIGHESQTIDLDAHENMAPLSVVLEGVTIEMEPVTVREHYQSDRLGEASATNGWPRLAPKPGCNHRRNCVG